MLLPGWLRPEGAGLAAGLLRLRRPVPGLLRAGSSISLSFSCSSFRKKSTNRLFSLLIWSLMSVGMSGIIQSTRTLRNITKFCRAGVGEGGEARPGWRALLPGAGVVTTHTPDPGGSGPPGHSGSSADELGSSANGHQGAKGSPGDRGGGTVLVSRRPLCTHLGMAFSPPRPITGLILASWPLSFPVSGHKA